MYKCGPKIHDVHAVAKNLLPAGYSKLLSSMNHVEVATLGFNPKIKLWDSIPADMLTTIN